MKNLTKRLIIGLVICSVGMLLATTGEAKISAQADKLGYIPGEVIVVLKSGSNLPPEVGSSSEYALNEKENLFGNVYKLKFSEEINMDNLKEWLEEFDSIKSVEFNKVIKQQTKPVEKLDNKWGLKKIKSTGAWDYETGSENITIAVIDSGIDKGHEDLKKNITLGHDYVDGDDEPIDTTEDSHGVHVAGIIGAVGDNNKGTTGVMWKTNLLIVRALDENGEATIDRMIEAITSTADKDVDIINMSWGVMSYSMALEEAINYAHNEGCILIAAAGNSGIESPFYPAAYKKVIGVVATTEDDKIASFSNYGKKYEIGAPGDGIYSTVKGAYGRLDGTSMSAGFVTGVAGLVLSKDPEANVENILLQTADSIDSNKQPNKRVNAYKAVKRAHEGEEPSPGDVKSVASVGEEGQTSIEAKPGKEIQFYSKDSTVPKGEELKCIWNFEDGNISQDANPTHVFKEKGSYKVELLVYSESGLDSSKVKVNIKKTDTPNDNGEATITGKVTDQDTGEPIEGARIYAKVKPGKNDYLIQAVKSGYRDGERTITLNSGDSKEMDFELKPFSYSASTSGTSGYVTIAKAKTDSNGEYELGIELVNKPKKATITGKVTDAESGEPIEGARIYAKVKPKSSNGYLIQAVKVGYYDGEKNKQLKAGNEVEVNFNLKQYNFSAAAESSNEGYITLGSTQTDENGKYELKFEIQDIIKQKADLIISNIRKKYSTNYNDARLVTFKVKIKNIGESGINRGEEIPYKADFENGKVLCERNYTGGLDAGESDVMSCPAGKVSKIGTGKHTVKAVVDHTNEVNESNENNNTESKTFQISGYSDDDTDNGTNEAVVKGKVVNKETEKPIKNATVYVKRFNKDNRLLSNKDNYLIKVVEAGFQDKKKTVTLRPGVTKELNFSLIPADFSGSGVEVDDEVGDGYITIAETETNSAGKYELEVEIQEDTDRHDKSSDKGSDKGNGRKRGNQHGRHYKDEHYWNYQVWYACEYQGNQSKCKILKDKAKKNGVEPSKPDNPGDCYVNPCHPACRDLGFGSKEACSANNNGSNNGSGGNSGSNNGPGNNNGNNNGNTCNPACVGNRVCDEGECVCPPGETCLM